MKDRANQEVLNSRQYTYDAFVIYCQKDSRWVVRQLIHRLETDDHFRLCIHERDWLAGENIADNIIDSIENSRKTLVIVSNAFLQSRRCQYEMMMAQTRHITEDRNNLILVLMEEIAEVNKTPRLRLQMQTQTYVEWTSSEVGQQLFWARLTQAMRRRAERVSDSCTGLPVESLFHVTSTSHE